MKQSSCLRTGYESCKKVRLGSSKYQSRIPSQDLINTLPETCIAEIFRHVENPEDRQSCASVSWSWANILVSQRPDFWGPFSVHQAVQPRLHMCKADDAKLAAAVVDISRRDMVTDLDLRCAPSEAVVAGVPRLTDSAIHFVTSACCNLKSVRLVNCLSLTNEAARTIASKCSALEKLVMLQSSISDDGLSQIAKKCRNLKSLHIEGSLSITGASLGALVHDAKRLESLTLGSCPRIGEDAILSLLMNHPYLDKLELKSMMVGVSYLNGARQSSALNRQFCLFRQLSSLILVKCPGLQDVGMLKLARIPFRMLRHLVVDDCRGLSELGLKLLFCDPMNHIKLKTIKLARFRFYSSQAVVEVMSLFSQTIESIILDSCDFCVIMPHCFADPVAWECPKLKVIRMEHCERIMDLFLSWVSLVCRGLQELRLIGFPPPAQAYRMGNILCGILQYNGITKVELRSCHFTDMIVGIIAQSCRWALQELILDECPNMLGYFVVFLRVHCPNLIKLTFNRIQIRSGRILSLLLAGFDHLEELDLMGCPLITGRILHILAATNLPRLKRVNLSGCPDVSQQIVDIYRARWEIET